ncbi:MinD/ParA family ATP-binding protein [Protofrankia symbiont of Coriaria ruscifolia]|uniref:MinD/ParA family ATP-binding protein n=1 Tax=Protofrankia symbiont of Coriaria ruscifolia TaxID=1306542 RepID=UPI0010410F5D|nr:chromosome partitioning protein [Protofrankia symbiont of Coriaria ruscifolia]
MADRVVAGRGDPGTLVARCRWVHVGGLEDGCGRTTVTAGLAMALAASRRDRIIAVDVCPDQPGMLAARLGPSSGYGPGHGPGHAPGRGDLARAGGLPAPLLPEVRRFVPSAGRTGRTGPAGQGSGPVGLDVLLGAPGADVFGRSVEEVGRALDVVEDWYEVALVDSPPGWGRPLPAALLARADTLVVAARAGFVTLSAVDDALAALADSGRGDLADSVAIAVVETVPTRWSGRARRRLARLAERAHSIVVVPFDPMLADGRPFTWSGLRRRTRAAFGELAAAVEAGPG